MLHLHITVASASSTLVQVLLAAGDTFRAAAAEQLQGWAERSGAQMIARADDRQKPAALLSAALDKVEVCLPAWRLHANLKAAYILLWPE